MDPEKSLDRVVSQRALQLSSSFPCQFCAIGFLSGICITSLILAALTSFGATLVLPFSTAAIFSTSNSSPLPHIINSTDEESGNCNSLHKDESRIMFFKKTSILGTDDKVSLLYSKWSGKLSKSQGQEGQFLEESESSTPDAPHLQNCRLRTELNNRLDTRLFNMSFPPWTLWKGMLNDLPFPYDEEHHRKHIINDGAYPPWVIGSDLENYPLTRKVQRDIWLHQHPLNCSDPDVKFLVADWERLPGFGIGAQLAGMSGLLAIAINEKRILVTDYYNRADHEGCEGSSRSSWSCYFFPETSPECRSRAFELMKDKAALGNGTVTTKANYTSRDIWSGKTPRKWGSPWSNLQPTTEINGSFIVHHRKMDRRWWRAQAVRYLMRFQSEYTCNLMNIARHAAFGLDAAKLVLSAFNEDLAEDGKDKKRYEIEKFVWSDHKPWVPGPLLSMHVRMGDKACEMKVVEFEDYMHLANRIRKRFPQLNSVWLSTEMQDVIDKSQSYPNWKFYYTNVTRQTGNITMATYEASLGRETSTNYPIVNFLMASEADFFVGALGSTWCFLIDGMRNTGGKVMSGYLSVNKDRFW